jgi:mannosyltransferase OCH1-like enzyme
MIWPKKALTVSLIGCILTLFFPLASTQTHIKKTKSIFNVLMGDCRQAKFKTPDLRPEDRADLKVLSKAYNKNIHLLKGKPLHSIPHQMHLIWIGPRPFPEESIENVRSFRKYHPDWIMNFWTDSPDRQTPIPGMVRRLVTNEYFLPIFDLYTRSTSYGEKADLMRFVIMFKEGGLYFDHDATCLRSLEPFADHFDFIAACERLQYHEGIDAYITPAIGLFLCRPNHPILQKSWSLARERWDTVPNYPAKEAWKRVIYRTFDSFAKASMQLHNSNGNRDLILPVSYFYPNGAFKKPFVKKLQKAGYVYSVHGFKGAWR